MQYFPPFFTIERHGLIRRLDSFQPDIPDKSPVDPGFFHRIQVFLHPFFRDIPRNPIPINGSLYLLLRIHEAGFKHILILATPRKRDNSERQSSILSRGFLMICSFKIPAVKVIRLSSLLFSILIYMFSKMLFQISFYQALSPKPLFIT